MAAIAGDHRAACLDAERRERKGNAGRRRCGEKV